ncbi:MAG: hypothetical protein H6736_06565 [Alphaproteobacteria bacterium]|nr:hypothetical protein [Alphaproteobacteria bacterium]MCB9691458.1 hypothetical protein [Alphaproteobacteria bacterium]
MTGRLRLAFLDALDERVLPLLAGAVGVLLAGQWFAGATSMGAPARGSLDFALWWAWLASGAMALVLGSRALALPLDDGSARFLLSGPLHPGRWGLERLAATAVVAVGFAGVLALAVSLFVAPVPPVAWSVFLVAEVVMLVAFAGLTGVLLRPLPALALGGAVWWIGHLAGPWATVMTDAGYPGLARVLPFLPDLDTLDAHAATLAGQPVPAARLGLGIAWALAWTAASAGATVSLLSARDL